MKKRWSLLFLFLLLQCFELNAWADSRDIYNENQQLKMDELADACARQSRPDEICSIIVHARQIGNDTIEGLKEFLQLTPEQYAILTAANALAQGRVRIRSRVPHTKGLNATLDIQRSEVRFLLEKTF